MNEQNLKIEYLPIEQLKPYDRNTRRHTEQDVQYIVHSIEQFGMCDPIGVWGKENTVVEGHGRLEALKQLGYTRCPVIRLDHLSDEERRAYGIAHNKTAEGSAWDDLQLHLELDDLADDFSFSDFGFDIEVDAGYNEIASEEKPNERERTFGAYNLELIDPDRLVGKYQMPQLDGSTHIPDKLIGFNYMLSSKDTAAGIHCFVDDYQFERLWNAPQDYIYKIDPFDCFLTPDFSLYTDMPMAMKIWNVYRSRLLGQFYQSMGIEVIPTVSWAEPETFDFCFDGLPTNAVLAISTIGVKRSDHAFALWKQGMDEMIRRLTPCAVLEYGGDVGYDYGAITVKRYANEVTERMKGA